MLLYSSGRTLPYLYPAYTDNFLHCITFHAVKQYTIPWTNYELFINCQNFLMLIYFILIISIFNTFFTKNLLTFPFLLDIINTSKQTRTTEQEVQTNQNITNYPIIQEREVQSKGITNWFTPEQQQRYKRFPLNSLEEDLQMQITELRFQRQIFRLLLIRTRISGMGNYNKVLLPAGNIRARRFHRGQGLIYPKR